MQSIYVNIQIYVMKHVIISRSKYVNGFCGLTFFLVFRFCVFSYPQVDTRLETTIFNEPGDYGLIYSEIQNFVTISSIKYYVS